MFVQSFLEQLTSLGVQNKTVQLAETRKTPRGLGMFEMFEMFGCVPLHVMWSCVPGNAGKRKHSALRSISPRFRSLETAVPVPIKWNVRRINSKCSRNFERISKVRKCMRFLDVFFRGVQVASSEVPGSPREALQPRWNRASRPRGHLDHLGHRTSVRSGSRVGKTRNVLAHTVKCWFFRWNLDESSNLPLETVPFSRLLGQQRVKDLILVDVIQIVLQNRVDWLLSLSEQAVSDSRTTLG